MFLFMLGGSLALGGGLFAIASYSEGALLATRTVAQVIGWLFVVASLAGAAGLRRSDFAGITTAAVTLASGLMLVYVSHFDWSDIATVPSAYAAVETRYTELKVIETPSPALAAALGMKEMVVPHMPKTQPEKALLAVDHSAVFLTVEALQRSRCAGKAGVAWLVCQESARLEYCQSREGDEATCPSPIPPSYPG